MHILEYNLRHTRAINQSQGRKTTMANNRIQHKQYTPNNRQYNITRQKYKRTATKVHRKLKNIRSRRKAINQVDNK